ncbi:MAG: hypothetical protein JNJ48_08680 [Phycisphaerae bacterium]|nr:hypothetical protein [Phycisphaerae bacterium]
MTTKIRNAVLATAGALLSAAGAHATTINSFNTVTGVTGIIVTPSIGSPNLTFNVSLSPGATVTYLSNTYTITDIIGFYMLAPGFNDTGRPALSNFAGFSDDSDNRAAGSIFGWLSNPNQGITQGNSQTFTYPSVAYPNYTEFGFHIRVNGTLPTGGNTFNIRGGFVPTPGAGALLGLGGLIAMRRRR